MIAFNEDDSLLFIQFQPLIRIRRLRWIVTIHGVAVRRLDKMASCWWEACLLGIVDYVASHTEPHVEHEGIDRETEAGHWS